MKQKLLLISTILTVVLSAAFTSAPAPQKQSKILIAYFTFPEPDGVDAVAGASRHVSEDEILGNTQYIARLIQEETGGDLFPIKTVHTYPGEHKPLIDYAKKEKESGTKPRLTDYISNPDDYDILFVGFPNWWYDMPMPLYTFFEQHDFAGKTIIPFCTHGGSGFSQTIKTITALQQQATVIKGISISRDNITKAKPNVQKWLQDLNLNN